HRMILSRKLFELREKHGQHTRIARNSECSVSKSPATASLLEISQCCLRLAARHFQNCKVEETPPTRGVRRTTSARWAASTAGQCRKPVSIFFPLDNPRRPALNRSTSPHIVTHISTFYPHSRTEERTFLRIGRGS